MPPGPLARVELDEEADVASCPFEAPSDGRPERGEPTDTEATA